MSLFLKAQQQIQNIRQHKKAINKALKKLRVGGVAASHLKYGGCSLQEACDAMRNLFGENILEANNFIYCLKIKEGKTVRPNVGNHISFYWRGDKMRFADALKAEGLEVRVPESDNTTIQVVIKNQLH